MFKESNVEVLLQSEKDVIAEGFGNEPTLYITNNNFLYADREAIFEHLRTAPHVVSACWLFDNHHQFELSTQCAKHFDLVFPAHCNGTKYLFGHKAVVEPVVPCATIQWSLKEAVEYYAAIRRADRDDVLYGRFASYEGRVAVRDHFLHALAATSFGREIKSLKAAQQDWYHKTPFERFANFAGHKVAVSTPVYNDIPIRIFDSLLAGQISIVPYGSLGLETAVSLQLQQQLPILTYLPNDLDSLQASSERAVAIFDKQGQAGADFRHNVAVNGHMLVHRVADIIRLVLKSAEG